MATQNLLRTEEARPLLRIGNSHLASILRESGGLAEDRRNGEAAPAHLRRAEAGCSGSRGGRSHNHGDQPRDHQLLRHRDGGQVLVHPIIRVSNNLILLHHIMHRSVN